MSDKTANAVADGGPGTEAETVPGRLLLGIYAVVPAVLLLLFVDRLALGSSIEERLPRLPQTWAWWALVFNVPHIVASYFSFFDRDYLRHYARPLSWVLFGAAAIAIGLPRVVGHDLFLAFFAVVTMIHVLAQQLGIALGLARIRSPLGLLWKTAAVAGSCGIYLSLFSPTSLNRLLGKPVVDAWLPWFAFGCSAVATAAAIGLIRWSRTGRGRQLIVANVAMVWTAQLAWAIGYPVFAVVVPRVIHDLTAFSVYAAHDRSRNRERLHNPLYAPARWSKLPFAIYTPLLAISLHWALLSEPTGIVLTVSYALALGHYSFESFVWKSGSLHRRYVTFG